MRSWTRTGVDSCSNRIRRTATLIAVEIVRKNPDQIGFAVNPRRWVVERFFAWIGRNRRLAKDFEATIDSARAFLYAASVMHPCVMTFETDSKVAPGRPCARARQVGRVGGGDHADRTTDLAAFNAL